MYKLYAMHKNKMYSFKDMYLQYMPWKTQEKIEGQCQRGTAPKLKLSKV